MKRLFWVALGLGAGVATAIMSARFLRRQREKVAPARLAREARGGVLDLAKLLSESIAEGKHAMREKEAELHQPDAQPAAGQAGPAG